MNNIFTFREGELNYYKSSLPKELKKYGEDFPENKEYVERFLDNYRYDYVEKKWKRV